MDEARLRAWVRGRVQGVGFRDWVRRQAGASGLRGWAENRPDGSVLILAEGERAACQALLDALGSDRPPGFVGDIGHAWEPPAGEAPGFRIR